MKLTDKQMIEALLGELRYVLVTGDLCDSERNSFALRESAAIRLGFASYDRWEEAVECSAPSAQETADHPEGLTRPAG